MKSHRVITFITAALVAALTGAAQEKKIDRSQLPPAVEKTVQAQSQGATIKGFSTEVEHGKRAYEVEMIVDGRTRDIEIAPDGTLNEVEDEVALETLPAPAQTALNRKAAGAKITKVESLTKHGKLVAYEAATLRGAKKGEVQVGPDGASLVHPE